LATFAEPHAYDMCDEHARRLSAPMGWELVRLEFDPADLAPSSDDLEALANAVREAARPAAVAVGADTEAGAGRRGHLRVLRPVE
jgi:hypothetical protein